MIPKSGHRFPAFAKPASAGEGRSDKIMVKQKSIMTRKQRRLVLIGSSLGVLALAAVLVLSALKDSIVFFNSPTDVVEKKVPPGSRIRLGGLVKPGTLQRGDQLAVRFDITDGNRDILVRYQGILPDLFREGQGVLAEGTLGPGGGLRDYAV